jgi:hypothetical protein
MSLKSQYKVDPGISSGGAWFNFPANENGTIPGFKLSRMSVTNPRYAKQLDKSMAAVTAGNIADGEPDRLGAVELFVRGVLVDWRNVQPEDNGVVLEYSYENAMTFLGDLAWADLINELRAKAASRTQFLANALETQGKNSLKS